MLFKARIVMISLVFATNGLLLADEAPQPAQYSAEITLASLSHYVYQHHPARLNELAHRDKITANTAFANSLFSDVSRIDLRHQNDLLASDAGLIEWEATATMQLWQTGQKGSQLALSLQMSAQLTASQQQVKLVASRIVRLHIWQIVLAELAEQQTRQIWLDGQTLAHDVEARVIAGELAGTERLLANSHVFEVKNKHLQAQAQLMQVLKRYQYLTGQTALPTHYIEHLSEQTDIDPQHPDIAVIAQQINGLLIEQDLASFSSSYNSNISVGIRSERDLRGDNFSNSIGLGINFALDDKVYRQAAIANAAKDLADAQVNYQQLMRQLTISLAVQLDNLAMKQQQLVLINQQESQTKQYLDLQQRAFELGEINLVAILQSQTIYNQVHNQQQKVKVELQQLIAMINQSLGIIL